MDELTESRFLEIMDEFHMVKGILGYSFGNDCPKSFTCNWRTREYCAICAEYVFIWEGEIAYNGALYVYSEIELRTILTGLRKGWQKCKEDLKMERIGGMF